MFWGLKKITACSASLNNVTVSVLPPEFLLSHLLGQYKPLIDHDQFRDWTFGYPMENLYEAKHIHIWTML